MKIDGKVLKKKVRTECMSMNVYETSRSRGSIGMRKIMIKLENRRWY